MTSSVASKDDRFKQPSERFFDAIDKNSNETVLSNILEEYFTKENKLVDRQQALKQLLNRKGKNGALISCFSPVKFESLKYVLRLGIETVTDPNDGQTAKKYLLDVNQRSLTGNTGPMLAIRACSLEVLELFEPYEGKIDFNIRNHQGQYLGHLLGDNQSQEATIEVIKFMHKKGVDFNKRHARSGRTPLVEFAACGQKMQVKCLLMCKELIDLDLNAQDDKGFTAVTIADAFGKDDCRDLVLEHGALNSQQPSFPFDVALTEKADENVDVDEMKIQTMFKMVEDCRIHVQGRELTKKVLYLTNKQALMFDEQTIGKAIEVFEIDYTCTYFAMSFIIRCVSNRLWKSENQSL
jgi:ankyrin repeat protein